MANKVRKSSNVVRAVNITNLNMHIQLSTSTVRIECNVNAIYLSMFVRVENVIHLIMS